MSEEQPREPSEPPILDADDAKDSKVDPDFPNADLLAENLKKAASEAAYATIGLVDLLSSKAKELYAEQKAQRAADSPVGEQPASAGFLAQLGGQLDLVISGIAGSFKDLADRGRQAGRADEADVTAADPAIEEVAGDAVEVDVDESL